MVSNFFLFSPFSWKFMHFSCVCVKMHFGAGRIPHYSMSIGSSPFNLKCFPFPAQHLRLVLERLPRRGCEREEESREFHLRFLRRSVESATDRNWCVTTSAANNLFDNVFCGEQNQIRKYWWRFRLYWEVSNPLEKLDQREGVLKIFFAYETWLTSFTAQPLHIDAN